MAEAVRRRDVSPVDVIGAHIAQIERVAPRLNPFIEVYADEAMRAALDAESAIMRGENTGPLHGIPVTIKDSFDLAGHVTACGSVLRAQERAGRDALCVERLRAAGAIVIAKTSCPEFLMNYETDNHLVGRTNNPWDETRTAGGSSGGESAAIASFCSVGGMGSDGGGSVREPAHFCGIAGIKPTPGRVPATGHWPHINHPGGLMGVAGPMARNAADLKVLFDVVEGYDPRDPFSVPLGEQAPTPLPVRVQVMEQFASIPVEPSIRTAVRTAARILEEMGYPLDAFDAAPVAAAPEVWRFLFVDVIGPLLRMIIHGREAQCHRLGLELIGTVKDQPEPSSSDLCIALARRDAIRAALLKRMQDAPVILAPGCGVAAFRHGQRVFKTESRDITLLEAMAPLTFVNLLGLPAVSVPVMLTPEGLPVGVQFVGMPWSEDLLLELAIRFERARGPFPAFLER